MALARALWKSPWHEEKFVAVHTAAALAHRLEDRHWREFRRWIEGAAGTGHADAVAVRVLGRMVELDRSWCRVLRDWAHSGDARIRRAAAGAVLLRTRHMGDVEAAFSICGPMMADDSPQVREAVAAVLQEAFAADGPATGEFLDRWKGRLPAEFFETVLHVPRSRPARRSAPGRPKDGV